MLDALYYGVLELDGVGDAAAGIEGGARALEQLEEVKGCSSLPSGEVFVMAP